MTTRVLETPRYPELNLRIYQDNGSLLAAMLIPTEQRHRYISGEMLYRYCSLIFLFPEEKNWGIFRLLKTGATGGILRSSGRTSVNPGDYIVLDQDQNPITVNLTTNSAPRRIRTHDISPKSQGYSECDQLQIKFRNSLRKRDDRCAITGRSAARTLEQPFLGLEATHIFPVSMLGEWTKQGYRQYITDTRPTSEIGESGLYSIQNGLLLGAEVHCLFDQFQLGVDPDADYKIIVFAPDPEGMGGNRLRSSARCGTECVSADLLRWHLRMCLYKALKANAELEPIWEEDLGEDPVASILEQPDAAERMEVELFTRLGGQIA
ncbi:uncharacterized protein PGRI_025780 [Penicillium griseofulvum]|uniref:HNH nuclease domain-containing protein n=1 Tax=Penicillium patulum TaxID=5078 RepID=A0A135LIE0_PENPA|nr:uncharacterized protein PGRI_025780 [Penicillium griseofulvum]KXG48708.1 hypothetical protein PGRI_025780 [Penicillium griseofulvum]